MKIKYRAFQIRAAKGERLRFGVFEMSLNNTPVIPAISKWPEMSFAQQEATRLNEANNG